MTLTFYKDYMELFQGCVLYMDGSSPTIPAKEQDSPQRDRATRAVATGPPP